MERDTGATYFDSRVRLAKAIAVREVWEHCVQYLSGLAPEAARDQNIGEALRTWTPQAVEDVVSMSYASVPDVAESIIREDLKKIAVYPGAETGEEALADISRMTALLNTLRKLAFAGAARARYFE